MQGGSHDQTKMLPIKAGVAFIYMGAVDKYNVDPEILACGINYDNGHKFRSTAILEFGMPYKMPPSMIDAYKDPEQKNKAVNHFLNLLSSIEIMKLRDSTTSKL